MGYSLIGHFVDVRNKKKLFTCDLDYLKVFNEMRYSCEFDKIIQTSTTVSSDFPFVTNRRYVEILGYYDPAILDDPELSMCFKKTTYRYINEDAVYIIDEGVSESRGDVIAKYKIDLWKKKSEDESFSNYIAILENRVGETTGIWYRQDDFERAKSDIEKSYFEKKDRVAKLESMKDGYEWFKMDDKSKENYYESLEEAKEDLELAECEYESITKINNIFSFISREVVFDSVDENGISHSVWYFDDNRDVEVYIEVV